MPACLAGDDVSTGGFTMKSKHLSGFVALAGFLCLVMQKLLFAKMDARGLLPSGHPISYIIAGSVLAVVLVLVVYLLKGSNGDYRIYINLPLQAVGCFAAAIGQIYWAFSANEGKLFLILKLAAAVCFLVVAYYRLQKKKPPLIALAGICMALMVLCFGQYRIWSRYTQLQEYLFPALSALFLVLYSLECCTMELPQRNCKKALIFNQAALFSTIACFNYELWPYYLAMFLWLASGLFAAPGAVILPKSVQKCMNRLEKAGYTVYAVGGCVRDSLLGGTPSDYDLCTSATPEEIVRVFENFELVRAGEKHGTIGVIMGGRVYEITTYRTESGYADNRHPDSVVFVDRVEEDLARRDFTVNAMAYHPKTGVVDPFGGQKDLFAGILRAVGDPETRFREDSLRILRGVRFACRFRLQVEPQTEKAMKELAPLMDNLAPERVLGELTQILCAMEQGDLVRFREIMVQAVPELADCVDFQQHNPHHAYDVFTHTDRVLTGTPKDPVLRWAALLHDVAKPLTFTQDASGKGHFYGHAKESARMADEILSRLRASNMLKEQVVFLVAHHMDASIVVDEVVLRKKLSMYGMETLTKVVKLQQADQGGKKKNSRQNADLEKILEILTKLEKEEGRLQIRDLAVNGHDLMDLGFAPGPDLGKCQQMLLEQVLEGKIPNEKEALLKMASAVLMETGGEEDA